MKPMDLDNKSSVRAPRPETIALPGFFRATNGNVCTYYCGALISVEHISGSDAVHVNMAVPDDTSGLYRIEWEEDCNTHEAMLTWIQKMCQEAYKRYRGRT